jgi:hypothetical protein
MRSVTRATKRAAYRRSRFPIKRIQLAALAAKEKVGRFEAGG